MRRESDRHNLEAVICCTGGFPDVVAIHAQAGRPGRQNAQRAAVTSPMMRKVWTSCGATHGASDHLRGAIPTGC